MVSFQTGLDVFKEKHPEREWNEDIDQFITRIVDVKTKNPKQSLLFLKTLIVST
jgi:hypothetical protein